MEHQEKTQQAKILVNIVGLLFPLEIYKLCLKTKAKITTLFDMDGSVGNI